MPTTTQRTLLLVGALLVIAAAAAVTPASAAVITGNWSVPRFSPPARWNGVLGCWRLYNDAAGFDQSSMYGSPPRVQLFGGELLSGDADKNAYTYYDGVEEWFPQANTLPYAASGFALALDAITGEGVSYMWGGHKSNGAFAGTALWQSTFGQPWKRTVLRANTKDDAPALTRMGFWIGSLGTDGAALFVWGGLSASGINPSLYAFMLSTGTTGLRWVKPYTSKSGGPAAVFDTCCVAIGSPWERDKSVCIGGAGVDRDNMEVWEHDATAIDCSASPCGTGSTWTQLHDGVQTPDPINIPARRRGHSCAYLDWEDVIVVYGGYDANTGKAIADTNLYRFKLGSNEWHKTAQTSTRLKPVYGAMLTNCLHYGMTIRNEIYLVGGSANGVVTGETHHLDFGEPWHAANVWPAHSTNLQLTLAGQPSETRPVGRAEHVAVLSGGDLIILFGRSGLTADTALGDVWRYNLEDKKWTEITLLIDETELDLDVIPRTGAAAIEYRSGILVFGGNDKFGLETNDLFVLQPQTGELRLVAPSTTARPPARAYHVMTRLGDEVVIGGGWSLATGNLGDWWRFDTITQEWSQLTVDSTGDKPGTRLAMAALERYNSTHSIVGLGYGAQIFGDWYFASFATDSNNTAIKSVIRFVKINVDYSNITQGERGVIRAYTAIGGTGSNVLVCGGAISEFDPAPPATQCYQLDVRARKIYVFESPYAPSVYGTTTFVKGKALLFGGQKITATSFADQFIDFLQIFNIDNLCAPGTADDTNCIECSKGTLNVGNTAATRTCQLAPMGTYVTNPLFKATDCPAGKFSKASGAFSIDTCIPCPRGTYNDKEGQSSCVNCTAEYVCPSGSTTRIAAASSEGLLLSSQLSVGGRIRESNPKSYEPLDPPWFVILFIGLTAIILTALVSFVLGLAHYVWRVRRDFFVPDEVREQLKIIYLQYAKSMRGMNEAEFVLATYSEQFPPHEGSVLEMQQLFQELNVNGTGALTWKDFMEAFVLLISRGHMQPLAGSQAEKAGTVEFEHWGKNLIGKYDVRKFDRFADDHMTAGVGEKILAQELSYGGAISIFFYVIVIILILAIVINFLYANTQETKASVPRSVIQSSFGSIFQVTSDITASVIVSGPVRSLDGISTLAAACATTSAVTGAQRCRSVTDVSLSNVLLNAGTGKVQPLECSYDNTTRGCTVTWRCTDCYVPEGSTGTLFFRIAPQVAALTLEATVSVTTGIRDPVMEFTGKVSMVGGPNQRSSVTTRAVPTVNTKVMTGMPPTDMYFGLTPSYYEADEVEAAVDSKAEKYRATGYHVRQTNSPKPGNEVPVELFSQYYDAPLRINLKVDEVPLLVVRNFQQTLIQLIVSLLGAIAGVGGALEAAVQFLDTHTGKNENSTVLLHDKLEDEDEMAGLEEMYRGVHQVLTLDEYKLVRPLIERGVLPSKAAAFLEVLRRKRTGKSGSGYENAARGGATGSSPSPAQQGRRRSSVAPPGAMPASSSSVTIVDGEDRTAKPLSREGSGGLVMEDAKSV